MYFDAHRFTKPEKLGAKEYSCSKCTKAHEAVKRLSILKLPPVLSFQFKVRRSPSYLIVSVRVPRNRVSSRIGGYERTALRTQDSLQGCPPKDRHTRPVPRVDQHGTVHDARYEQFGKGRSIFVSCHPTPSPDEYVRMTRTV
jgi:hypothetical protein